MLYITLQVSFIKPLQSVRKNYIARFLVVLVRINSREYFTRYPTLCTEKLNLPKRIFTISKLYNYDNNNNTRLII